MSAGLNIVAEIFFCRPMHAKDFITGFALSSGEFFGEELFAVKAGEFMTVIAMVNVINKFDALVAGFQYFEEYDWIIVGSGPGETRNYSIATFN